MVFFCCQIENTARLSVFNVFLTSFISLGLQSLIIYSQKYIHTKCARVFDEVLARFITIVWNIDKYP